MWWGYKSWDTWNQFRRKLRQRQIWPRYNSTIVKKYIYNNYINGPIFYYIIHLYLSERELYTMCDIITLVFFFFITWVVCVWFFYGLISCLDIKNKYLWFECTEVNSSKKPKWRTILFTKCWFFYLSLVNLQLLFMIQFCMTQKRHHTRTFFADDI